MARQSTAAEDIDRVADHERGVESNPELANDVGRQVTR